MLAVKFQLISIQLATQALQWTNERLPQTMWVKIQYEWCLQDGHEGLPSSWLRLDGVMVLPCH